MAIDAGPWRDVDRPDLWDTRVTLHHAAQVVSALGATHLEADADHQYANLGWDRPLQALCGRPVGSLRAGLQLAEARWILADGPRIVATSAVRGATLADGLAWLATQAAVHGGPAGALSPVGYELPDHPAAAGAALSPLEGAASTALARWFDNADAVLGSVARRDGASEVRCWPHHFDIATLITLSGRGEDARTIGVGMTPGDAGRADPYLYVTPWPYPDVTGGPELPAGHWNLEGWFGAVLAARELPAVGQGDVVAAFLGRAIEACRQLL